MIFTNMNRAQRMMREAKRHSLFFLASLFATLISICGILTGIQYEDGELVVICSVFATLFTGTAIHHASESLRHFNLYDLETQNDNENQTL